MSGATLMKSASLRETGTALSWIDASKISETDAKSSTANSGKAKLGTLSGQDTFARLRLENFV